MITTVFDFGDFNSQGVCHAICGQWIKKSRAIVRWGGGGGVTSLSELGDKMFLKRVWDEADDTKHINRNNLLGHPLKTVNISASGGTLNTMVAARELTLGYNQYYLLIIDFADSSRHALAAKRMRMPGGLQFLDPNDSCWQYDNSFEMYEHIRDHIADNYGDLSITESEISTYSPG